MNIYKHLNSSRGKHHLNCAVDLDDNSGSVTKSVIADLAEEYSNKISKVLGSKFNINAKNIDIQNNRVRFVAKAVIPEFTIKYKNPDNTKDGKSAEERIIVSDYRGDITLTTSDLYYSMDLAYYDTNEGYDDIVAVDFDDLDDYNVPKDVQKKLKTVLDLLDEFCAEITE